MGILNSMRERPDNQKKIFSLITAVILTLIIVVVWFSFGENKADNDLAGAEPAKLSSLSPIQVIKDEFSKAFSNFKETMPDLASTTDITDSTSTIPVQTEEASSTPLRSEATGGQAASSTDE